MNNIEASKILAVLSATYPRNICKDDAAALIRLWTSIFSDYSYSDVGAAVLEFIKRDTKGFMPVPGQILEIVESIELRRLGAMVENRFIELLAQNNYELQGGDFING